EWSKEDIRLRQDEDDVIRLVKERLRDQQPFGRAAMRDPLFRPYRKLWSVLFLDDSDLLVRMVKYLPEDEKSYVPVIPESLRKPLLYKFHDLGGHFGKQHMWDRMRRLCFWPGMNVDITDYVAQCDRCLTIKARQQPASALVPFPVGAPWHTIAVDFLFVGPSNEGSTKLLVIVDHFTRWADAYVVKGEGSIDALAPLLQLFSQFGPPARILSDQGTAFESDVFCNALKILGISKVRSTPHHPSSNGHVERFNSTILNLLRTATQTLGDWQGHLRSVLWQYNTCPHSATGFSPFYLMYGRDPPQTLLPSLYQYSSLMHDPTSYAAYLARARAKIADVVDEWVTANGAPHRLAADQPLSHRRHFVGQRFVAGANNKTVVVRHFPDMKEKVISTDYILADPAQPDTLPPQLNIVRMDPPVNEAPRGEPRVIVRPVMELPQTVLRLALLLVQYKQNAPADVVEPVPSTPVADSVQSAQPPLRVTRTGR
ncbi:hypothetical protein FOZ63_003778, partial [Perkinsus olseni]